MTIERDVVAILAYGVAAELAYTFYLEDALGGDFATTVLILVGIAIAAVVGIWRHLADKPATRP